MKEAKLRPTIAPAAGAYDLGPETRASTVLVPFLAKSQP